MGWVSFLGLTQVSLKLDKGTGVRREEFVRVSKGVIELADLTRIQDAGGLHTLV